MEIKNKEAFDKAFPYFETLNSTFQVNTISAWNAAIESMTPKPKKWEPQLGKWLIYANSRVQFGSNTYFAEFGMTRETEAQAIKARDDYRIVHLIHTWLTEQGWDGEIRVSRTLINGIAIEFIDVGEKLSDEFFQKFNSGEIEL